MFQIIFRYNINLRKIDNIQYQVEIICRFFEKGLESNQPPGKREVCPMKSLYYEILESGFQTPLFIPKYI
jgi:hypothetical protein